MTTQRKARGGIAATVGFILSPLSFWNDIYVNIPIAYVFGLLFALVSKDLFLTFMIIGYWITNILGLILMHWGVKDVVSKSGKKYTKNDALKDVVISVFYTLVIVVLVMLGILRFPTEYF